MRSLLALVGKAVKVPLRAALDVVPLSVWQRLFPKDVIGLTYHVVSDEDLPHIKYYSYKTSRRFEADVVYARECNRLMRYDELVWCRRQRERVAKNAFFFSFDDGLVECFDVIRPILSQYDVDGAFFIPSDFIDNQTISFEIKVSLCLGAVERLSAAAAAEQVALLGPETEPNGPGAQGLAAVARRRLSRARLSPPATPYHQALILRLLAFEQVDTEQVDRMCEQLGVEPMAYVERRRPYMTTEQLCQLVEDGFTVGAHGMTHMRMQHMSVEQMEREIVTSCDLVRQITGQKRVPFAFPYSGHGISRQFLSDLLDQYPFIELFFDTRGICTDSSFIVNRFQADWPLGCIDDETNLSVLSCQEWSRRSAWTRSAF